MFYVSRVKRQIESGTDTNFENVACRRRDHTAAISGEISLPHRQMDQQGNDLILVETHGLTLSP